MDHRGETKGKHEPLTEKLQDYWDILRLKPLSHTTARHHEEKPLQCTGECCQVEGLNIEILKVTKNGMFCWLKMYFNNNVQNAGKYILLLATHTSHISSM